MRWDHYPFVCTTRAFLFAAGFSLAFGSMFTKTYRVHQIFTRAHSGVIRSKLLRDKQLLFIIGALLTLDISLISVWIVVDPMHQVKTNLSSQLSTIDEDVVYISQLSKCQSNHLEKWMGAMYAYKGLLLIFGVYMAWETRNVKIPALNDSRYIGMNVYNVVIMSTIVVVLSKILSDQPTLSYAIQATFIFLSTTGTLCLMFLPKIYAIMTSNGNPVITGSGITVQANIRRFDFSDKKELQYRAEIQNKVYKRELVALEEEINRLEYLLEVPNISCFRYTDDIHGLIAEDNMDGLSSSMTGSTVNTFQRCHSISDADDVVPYFGETDEDSPPDENDMDAVLEKKDGCIQSPQKIITEGKIAPNFKSICHKYLNNSAARLGQDTFHGEPNNKFMTRAVSEMDGGYEDIHLGSRILTDFNNEEVDKYEDEEKRLSKDKETGVSKPCKKYKLSNFKASKARRIFSTQRSISLSVASESEKMPVSSSAEILREPMLVTSPTIDSDSYLTAGSDFHGDQAISEHIRVKKTKRPKLERSKTQPSPLQSPDHNRYAVPKTVRFLVEVDHNDVEGEDDGCNVISYCHRYDYDDDTDNEDGEENYCKRYRKIQYAGVGEDHQGRQFEKEKYPGKLYNTVTLSSLSSPSLQRGSSTTMMPSLASANSLSSSWSNFRLNLFKKITQKPWVDETKNRRTKLNNSEEMFPVESDSKGNFSLPSPSSDYLLSSCPNKIISLKTKTLLQNNMNECLPPSPSLEQRDLVGGGLREETNKSCHRKEESSRLSSKMWLNLASKVSSKTPSRAAARCSSSLSAPGATITSITTTSITAAAVASVNTTAAIASTSIISTTTTTTATTTKTFCCSSISTADTKTTTTTTTTTTTAAATAVKTYNANMNNNTTTTTSVNTVDTNNSIPPPPPPPTTTTTKASSSSSSSPPSLISPPSSSSSSSLPSSSAITTLTNTTTPVGIKPHPSTSVTTATPWSPSLTSSLASPHTPPHTPPPPPPPHTVTSSTMPPTQECMPSTPLLSLSSSPSTSTSLVKLSPSSTLSSDCRDPPQAERSGIEACSEQHLGLPSAEGMEKVIDNERKIRLRKLHQDLTRIQRELLALDDLEYDVSYV
ncbi:gamma-aminobutyric acid type B receptor subunit 1-like [Argonauta hians]